MVAEAKKYKVSILGETYSLVSDESEEVVNRSFALIEELINDISTKSSTLTGSKIVAFALIKAALKANIVLFELDSYKKKEKRLEEILNHSQLL